jgi:FkbM family methyltransferase
MDVGANIGLIAAPILQRCTGARVVSFEPSPGTLKYLEKTVASSPYSPRWSLVAKALCEREGTLDFFAAREEMGGFDGLADTTRGGPTRKVSVLGSTLDVEWGTLGRPQVCVVKIDVEGAELRVLKGARRCIAVQHPPVLLEWNAKNLHAHGVSPSALLDFAQETNYSLHAVPGLVRVPTASELALHMKATESFLLWPSCDDTLCVARD